MNVFCYRDVLFELVNHQGRKFVLFAESFALDIRTWHQRPSLLDIRSAADAHVETLVQEASRAGGDVICKTCKEAYRTHRPFYGAFFMDHPYLTRLCDGKLVKL